MLTHCILLCKSPFSSLTSHVSYLDLRVCEYETKYYMCHNKLGCLMHEVLSDINTFIAEEPGEVVIVDFQVPAALP